jgi:hypothetical protein
VEPPGGESGNIERSWGMYNNPAGYSTPAFGAPHNNNNNNNNNNNPLTPELNPSVQQQPAKIFYWEF